MKKRIGALIVTMSFLVLGLMGMTVQADAATTQHGLANYMYTTDGAESINISLHKYNRFQSKEDQSYLLKNDNGGYTRLEFIKQGVDIYDEYGLFIEEYDKSFNLKSTKEVKMPYPIFGGVCFGEEYNFLFSSQINTWEEDDFPVMYIQIFDKEWTKEIERLEITNNTLGAKDPADRIYTAFGVASNLQMAEIGDNYYFHFGYEMCQLPEEWGQKIFHQRNATYVLKNTDSGWTFEMFPQLLVSHSWNQFITTDGEYLYLLDQQDGDSKGKVQKAAIYYQKVAKDSTNNTDIKSFKTDLKETYEAYQFTGTSLGSFKLIDNMFFTAGNSEEYYDRPAGLPDSHFNQRNIFVDLIDKNFTKDTYSRNWITEYPVVYEDDENYIDVGNPYIVTTDTEYQYVIWSEYIKKTDTSRLGIAKINKKGERVGDIHYIYGHLSDADPLYVDGKLIWYVTGYHEGGLDYPTKPVFYSINIADLEAGKYDYTESHKLENLTVELESDEVPYNSRSSSNQAKIASVTFDKKDYQLVEGVDYTVSYENNLKLSEDAGPAKAIITGKGMFAGVKNVEYQVVANDIGKQGYKLILNPAKVEYDPNILYHQRPKYTVVDAEGEVFDNSGSITLENVGENKNMKNIGVVTFAYTPETYGYTGTITADFTIAARESDLQNLSISFRDLSYKEYTGSAYEPRFYVMVGSSEVNHSVTYKNNVEAGTATAIIAVPGFGTFEKTFEITPKKFTGIKAKGWFGEYDGKPHTIEITGVPEGATVTYSLDGKNYTSEKPYFTDINTSIDTSGVKVYYKVSMPNYEDYIKFTRVQVRAVSHTCSWDKGTVTKQPTCTEEGVMTYTCTISGCTTTAPIPALEHGNWKYTYNNDKTHKRACGSCIYYTNDTCNFDSGRITKEATATQKGEKTYTCSLCKGTYIEYVEYIQPSKPVDTNVYRYYGADRYDTSIKAANALKAELGISKFDCIIVASGNTFADALPGSYLAAKNNAPILLINKKSASKVRSYISNNLVSGGKVYVLGGTAAVSSNWMGSIKHTRIGGTNRYDTNKKILEEAGVPSGAKIMVCTGKNFADSLSASATGNPILLVDKSLSNDQKTYLKKLSSEEYYIIGGTAAVNNGVYNSLKSYGKVKARLAGNSRYDTSVLVAKTFKSNAKSAVLAYAENFPDGLSGGPIAYAMDAPLILTKTGKHSVAASYAKSKGIKYGKVLGGTKLISDATVRTIFGVSKVVVK